MSVYKRHKTGPRGGKRELSRWWIKFADHNGRQHRFSAFTDKAASVELERKLRSLVGLRSSGAEPEGDLALWIMNMPDKLRARLVAWGLIDARRATAAEPLTKLIDLYGEQLLDRGCTADHAHDSAESARRVFAEAGAVYVHQVDPERVAAVLAKKRAAGMATNTSNGLLRAAKAVTRWLWKSRRIGQDPLAGLSLMSAAADRRRVHRALTEAEMVALIDTTERGPVRNGMDGRTRALLWRVALATGLRKNELRTLQVASFDFTTTPATVTVSAKRAKNRREAVLPLRADLAADLGTFVAGMSKLARPFPFSKNMGTEALKGDLLAASIPYKTERGYADVHSLRVTFGTSLARAGVSLVEAQRLMRHQDPALTANVYTDLRAVEASASVEKLPDLSRGRRALRATGTTGAVGNDPDRGTLGHTGSGGAASGGQESAFPGASEHILQSSAAGVGGIG